MARLLRLKSLRLLQRTLPCKKVCFLVVACSCTSLKAFGFFDTFDL